MSKQLTIMDNQNVEYNLWPDTVAEEVIQNILTLLRTEKYSVPLHRELGLSMDYVDAPTVAAQAMIRSDLFEMIPKYEPRVKVERISFSRAEENVSTLIPKVQVSLVE